MNFVSIIMDQHRNLLPDSYTLGVERDHGIEKIVLGTLQKWDDVDLFDSTVSLHLKADNGYLYNLVCTEKFSQNELVYFLFPINREMTCRSGKVKIEFSFNSPAVPFEFTSRSVDLMIAKPLTDTSEVESDYPGMLSDVLSAVQESSINVMNTQKDILRLKQDIDTVSEATNIVSDWADDIQAFLGYDDEQILGLEADFESNTFTRLAGAKGMNAGEDFNIFSMYGGRRRCNVSDDGTIMAYYGDENYRDDGTNGQVMVYQPKFYYRVVPTKLEKNVGGLGYHIRKANYYISEKARMGFKLHPAFYDENDKEIDYILYSAYEGSMYDVSTGEYVNDGTNTDTSIGEGDLLCSVAGTKPISGLRKPLSKTNFELMAQNRGSEWHLETVKAMCANQLLMMIELGEMNTQTAIGQGIVSINDNSAYNCASITGSTAYLGNTTGMADETVNEIGGIETVYTENGKVSVSYRGIENPWGNIWKHVQGLNVWGDGTMGGGQPYVANTFIFDEETHNDGNYEPVGFTIANAIGYIGAMGYGKEEFDWLLMPSEIGGTSELPVGDYTYATADLNGYRATRLGASWRDISYAGGFYWDCARDVGVRGRTIGGRLIYVPTAK